MKTKTQNNDLGGLTPLLVFLLKALKNNRAKALRFGVPGALVFN